MAEVDAARANLQTILDNLTAGVIVLDAMGLIRSSNPGAARILNVTIGEHYEGNFRRIRRSEDLRMAVQAQFDQFLTRTDQSGITGSVRLNWGAIMKCKVHSTAR
jgi:nitrogen fixation/metabolism regulation signal transduction histidine kinase